MPGLFNAAPQQHIQFRADATITHLNQPLADAKLPLIITLTSRLPTQDQDNAMQLQIGFGEQDNAMLLVHPEESELTLNISATTRAKIAIMANSSALTLEKNNMRIGYSSGPVNLTTALVNAAIGTPSLSSLGQAEFFIKLDPNDMLDPSTKQIDIKFAYPHTMDDGTIVQLCAKTQLALSFQPSPRQVMQPA